VKGLSPLLHDARTEPWGEQTVARTGSSRRRGVIIGPLYAGPSGLHSVLGTMPGTGTLAMINGTGADTCGRASSSTGSGPPNCRAGRTYRAVPRLWFQQFGTTPPLFFVYRRRRSHAVELPDGVGRR